MIVTSTETNAKCSSAPIVAQIGNKYYCYYANTYLKIFVLRGDIPVWSSVVGIT